MNNVRTTSVVAALAVGALATWPVTGAFAGTPPAAATAYAAAVIQPSGGSVSGFGVTATFLPGAVTSTKIAILGNWPNGLDVPPPTGQAVKTFGLQICDDTNGVPTNCTSEFGNYPYSPGSTTGPTERIDGMTVSYAAGQTTGVNFGSKSDKLVNITVNTGGQGVYIYNPNVATSAGAYPVLLPSTTANGVLSFSTFQPIVWTVVSSIS